MKKLIIYGTGDFGKRLYSFLNKQGITVDFFCQTKKENLERIFDIQILSIDQLRAISNVKTILIAVADREISKKIKMQLTNIFIEDAEVYECGEFIKANLFGIENKKYCLLCNSYMEDFIAAGRKEEIFNRKQIIGGGYREHVGCPRCHSIDRERWVFWVLSKYTRIFTHRCTVLHFAPEEMIEERIRSNDLCDYYSCDIVPNRAMHIADVTNIQFQDEIFDYIIINHVLEHIIDEKQAISELKRVLKDGGKIILSFPICLEHETIDDKNIVTKEERIQFYGQEDHVRLYGKDYKEHLEELGLKVEVYSPQDWMTVDSIDKYGFMENDILMICEK